jgi:SAM-dependent methyltransferase
MLDTLSANAKRLGVKVKTVVTEAEKLPFGDESFDLVFGHAILHHIPDLAQGFREFHRVLRPGGTLVFCGEPSRYGDILAAGPKRFALTTAPVWRRLVGASKRDYAAEPDANGHALEAEVDVHAFSPGDLRRFAADAGFDGVRVQGEELLANMHGWTMRTLEASAVPDSVPWGWRKFAFRSYIALQKVDNRVLEPNLPPQLFYNLLVSGRKPS